MTDTETAEESAPEAKPGAKPQRKRITRRQAVEQQARSYFEALDARDAGALGRHWADEGVLDLVAVGVKRGRGEVQSFFDSMFAAMPDLRTTVTRVVAGEQSCAVEWQMVGTFDGAAFMGIEPTDRHMEFRGSDLIELEDGQIVSNTVYFDGATFARQVGMLPPDGSGADRAMKGAFNAMTKVRRAVAERRSG